MAALRDRLQATPNQVREKAVDLRDDVEDRVQDIRVRDYAYDNGIIVWDL